MSSASLDVSTVSVDRYLDVLFARARPSTLVEVRWRRAVGMGQQFVPARDRRVLGPLLTELGHEHEVYVGVLPRWREAGGRGAVVGDGRTVWVDLDKDAAARALEPADPPPALVVASGAPGHLHAYWSLRRAEPPAVIERANRRLAWALGGDLASTDAARILRPPGTLHHARGGVEVVLADVVELGDVCRLSDLVGGLLDPPDRRAGAVARPGGRSRRAGGDWLLDVPPARYVAVLTGQRVDRSGKVHCPLHDDRTPSLHVYDDAARGWYCFGCRRGGSVYDLAGALWGIQPRGTGMRQLRDRLQRGLDPRGRHS